MLGGIIIKKQIPLRTDKYGTALVAAQNARERILCAPNHPYSENGLKAELFFDQSGETAQLVCKLDTDRGFKAERLFIRLGVDCYMVSYPDWDEKYFPTFVRCEKNGVWGCFVSPLGIRLAVASPYPFVSWKNEYEHGFDVGHRIFTVDLDILNRFRQPDRHPSPKGELEPGRYEFKVYFKFVESDEEVYDFARQYAGIKVCRFEKYTLEEFEKPSPLFDEAYTLENRNGRCIARIDCENAAQTRLYIRKPWSYYLKCAALSASKCQQKSGTHTESWYGYFTQAEYARYSGDKGFADRLINEFDEFLKFNTKRNGRLKKRALPHRLQNVSGLISLLTCFYRLTENIKYLNSADILASQLMELQGADGAFYSHGTHYTCVIYPAKSMLELALAERQAGLNDRFGIHYSSSKRAVEDLAEKLDNIETEGQMTFEDGMISCEALQLAFFALHTDDQELKKRLTAAAVHILNKHRCLEQTYAPDARIRGCTLRFWEARYDINFNSNMLNSPHGWTSWKNYASYYLYLLTGESLYLRELMDTMGACVQCIDDDGVLRWAFIPDPCIVGNQMVKSDNRRGYDFKETVVGEQYMPMISDWYRQNPRRFIHQYILNFKMLPGKFACDYGGSCDNDVNEHFKCLTETVLSKAFIHQENGKDLLYGCVEKDGAYFSRGDQVRTLVVYAEKAAEITFDGCAYAVEKGINLINVQGGAH